MIDSATGWCKGCRRSLDEIAVWGSAPADERRAILSALKERA